MGGSSSHLALAAPIPVCVQYTFQRQVRLWARVPRTPSRRLCVCPTCALDTHGGLVPYATETDTSRRCNATSILSAQVRRRCPSPQIKKEGYRSSASRGIYHSAIHPSIHHPSFIVHHPSSTIHHPSSIIHDPSSIIHRPSSTIHHPSSSIQHPASHHSSSIICCPSSIVHRPSPIVHHLSLSTFGRPCLALLRPSSCSSKP